jgi:chromosome segregation ATPase
LDLRTSRAAIKARVHDVKTPCQSPIQERDAYSYDITRFCNDIEGLKQQITFYQQRFHQLEPMFSHSQAELDHSQKELACCWAELTQCQMELA